MAQKKLSKADFIKGVRKKLPKPARFHSMKKGKKGYDRSENKKQTKKEIGESG